MTKITEAVSPHRLTMILARNGYDRNRKARTTIKTTAVKIDAEVATIGCIIIVRLGEPKVSANWATSKLLKPIPKKMIIWRFCNTAEARITASNKKANEPSNPVPEYMNDGTTPSVNNVPSKIQIARSYRLLRCRKYAAKLANEAIKKTIPPANRVGSLSENK